MGSMIQLFEGLCSNEKRETVDNSCVSRQGSLAIIALTLSCHSTRSTIRDVRTIADSCGMQILIS